MSPLSRLTPQRKRRSTQARTAKRKRGLLFQNLESRQLLAVDGFQIDLSGAGDIDLLGNDGGSSIHDAYANGGFGTGGNGGTGVTLGTSNVPGQNNELPIASEDTAAANEDGPAITINVSDLLANDSDPDSSGTLSITAVDSSGSLGNATLNSGAGTITYDPSGAFESLASGQTTVDVFEYTLDDGAGATSTGQVRVTITGSNDAPTVTGVTTVSANEGATATHTGTYADVDAGDTIALTASEGNIVDNNDGTWTWSLDTTDNAVTRDVTITATDGQTATGDFTFALTVDNVTPTIDLVGDDAVDEAATYNLTLGAVTDPGDETITQYEVDWGDGTAVETFADNSVPLKSHVYADGPNNYAITVSITDEDGKHVAATKTVTVNNVAPTVDADQATVTVDEGASANATGTYGDVGADTVSLSASIGNLVDNNDGTWSWYYSTTDGPNESQTVTITATDSDGAETQTTFDLVVNNLAPVVAADNATVTVDEGATANNTGTYSDVSGDTVTLSADVGTLVDNHDGTWSWSFDSTDGPDQTQLVTVTAVDEDGGQQTTTFNLVVNNLAPVAAPQSFDVLGNVPTTRDWSSLLVGAKDAGNDELTVQSIDSTTGDGTLTFDNTAKTFRYVPTTGFEGSTSFTFTIADSDGATHQETATITIDRSIWFVDNSAASGGDGSLASPFNSFSPLNHVEGAPDVDQEGDIIFVAGTATDYNVSHSTHNDGGFHLENGQFLIGSGLPDTLAGYLDSHGVSVPAGSDDLPTPLPPGPTLTNTTGDVVTVANNNTIAGFAADPTASAGIAGENISGLTVEFVIIITSGGDGDNEGIRLKTVTGTLTFNDLEIGSEDGETNSGTAIQIDGGTANIQFNDVDIDQNGGALLEILNTAASTITFDENSELNLQGSDEAAVTITGNNGGTVTLNSDGFTADTTAAVTFNISGNTGLTATTPVNDAPVFVLPQTTLQMLEDSGPQTITGFATDISAGPADESGQTLTFHLAENSNTALFATQPAIDSAGELTFAAADDASGIATLVVTLQDDGGTDDGGVDQSASQTITIHVNPVNDPPVLAAIANPTIDESVPFAFTATASDVDFTADTLSFRLDGTEPSGAAITSDGDFSWTPSEADGAGSFTFDVIVSDGELEDRKTLTITVNEVNVAPVFDAIADASIDEGNLLAFTVTATDADLPANTLTFSLDTNAPAGASITSGGDFTWTPTESQGPGTFEFEVLVSDGIATTTSQTVTITVADVNNAPVLASIGDQSGTEHQKLSFTASATDSDLPADTLTFSLGTGAPTGATITSDGLFAWTPSETQHGVHTIEILVSDGLLSDSEAISVTIAETNETPVLSAIGNQTLTEHVTHSFTATASDSDAPAQDLTFSLNGTVPVGAAISSAGVFSWTPAEDQHGTFVFDIVVSDGQASDAETVTWTVAETNEAPVLGAIANQVVDEKELLTFTATATDSDLPAQGLTFTLHNAPAGASMTPDGVFTWTPGEADGGQTFDFTVSVSDGELTDSSSSITITVNGTNDAPVLDAISNQSIAEGNPLTFTATATDSDLPTDTLTFSLAGDNVPAGASITADGDFSWTPSEADGPNTVSFDVVVSDGIATDSQSITIDVTEVNAAPVLSTVASQQVVENHLLTFAVTATDSDLPAQNLTFTLDSAPTGATLSGDGVFTWTPGETQIGTHTIAVTVTDNGSPSLNDSESFVVTVLSASTVLFDDFNDGTGGVPSGWAVEEAEGTAVENGSTLTLTGGSGEDQFIVLAADDSIDVQDRETTFTVEVDSMSNTPSFFFALVDFESDNGIGLDLKDDGSVEIGTIDDGPISSSFPLTGFDFNQAMELSFTIAPDGVQVVAIQGDLEINSGLLASTSLGGFELIDLPASLQPILAVGNPSGQVVVDQVQIDSVSFVNTAPVLASIGDRSGNEHEPLSFTATATDSDLPADTLTFALGTGTPTGATITSDGLFAWTPSETQHGVHTIEVIVSDGLLSDSETISVTIAETNETPILSAIGNQTLIEHMTHSFTATAIDSDAPAQDLTFSLSGTVPAGAAISSAGVFSWTPTEAQDGTFVFSVVVSDGTSQDTEEITFTVGETNQTPILAAIGSQSTDVSSALTFTATATDADLPANTLTFSLGNNAPAGATITQTGDFSWTPTAEQGSGDYTFDIVVSDGTATDTETITVTVNEPASGEAELFVGFIEERTGDDDAQNTVIFELNLQRDDLSGDSRAYIVLPGEAGYLVTDSNFEQVDHDSDSETPTVGRAFFELEIEQEARSASQFEQAIDGQWTVLIDVDGDFDANSPVEEASDAKFTFLFDVDAVALPPTPTITSPTDGTVLPSDQTQPNITFDLADGSMDGVDLGVNVFADAIEDGGGLLPQDSGYSHDTRSVATPELPVGKPLFAEVATLRFGGTTFVGQAQPVDGFDSIRWAPLDGGEADSGSDAAAFAQASIHVTEFSIGNGSNDDTDVAFEDLFDDGNGGAPSGWTVIESEGGASAVESGQALVLTGGANDDQFIVLEADESIDVQDRETTFTVMVNGLTNSPALFFALADLDADQGLGFDLKDDGTIELGTLDDGPVSSSLPLTGFDFSQPMELNFTLAPDGVRFRAIQGDMEVDSGFVANSQLSGFALSELPASLQPVLAVGNPNGQVVVESVLIESVEFDADEDMTTILSDTFENGSDINGVPTGWNSIQTGVYQTSAGQVTFQDIYQDDTAPVLRSTTSLGSLDGDVEITTTIGSITAGDTAGFGIGDGGDFDDGFVVGIERLGDTEAELFLLDVSADDVEKHSLTSNFPYTGGEVEITLKFDRDVFSVQTGDFNSGELAFATTFNADPLAGLESSSHPILFSVSDTNVEPDEMTPGNAAGAIVFHDIVVTQESSTSDEAFAEFELEIGQGHLPDGTIETFGYLDVSLVDSSQWTNDMQLHIKRPGGDFEVQPTGWSSIELDLEIADGQTVDQFIASLAGDYEVGVDYDGTTDGNSDFDESFTIALDLTGIDSSSFLDFPTIVSPTLNQVFAAGNRSVTIDWNAVTDADFYIAGLDSLDDVEVDTDTTQATFDFVPTGSEQLGFVGAASELERTTTGAGDPVIDQVFLMTAFRGVHFTIEPTLSNVPIGNSVGEHAGGANALGGLDYEFVGVHRDATFFADYLNFKSWDSADVLGGDARAESFNATVGWTGETFQIWDTELFDNIDEEVDFVHADLELLYDTSLLDLPWSNLSADQIEADLQAYQYDEDAGAWSPLRLLNRDLSNDTITVRMESTGPIVLGYDANGPATEPDDGSTLAEIDFEIFHAVIGGETVFGAGVDFQTYDPRVTESTTIKFKGPTDSDYRFITGGFGGDSTDIEPADGQSLGDFLDSLEGDYELHYDFAGDGTFEEFALFNLDTEGFDLSDFASAPTVTSPADGATLPSTNRTPTVTWNAVNDADYMIVDFQAVEPDGLSIQPTIFDTEVDPATTSVTSELLPTGVDFFVPVGAAKEFDDVPVQRGGTGEVDVTFELARFSPISFSIERADTDVPAGDSNGTLGGGSSVVGGIDYSLSGVAAPAKFRAEHQPIGPDQGIMEMVYGSRQAVVDSYNVFYPGGDTHQGWRINLIDDQNAGVVATGLNVTLQYDDSVIADWANEADLRPFQYNDATGVWAHPQLVSHNTAANTMTIQTDHIVSIVLAIPFASDLRATSIGDSHVCHAVLNTEQLAPIVEAAIERLAATGLSEDQIQLLESTHIEITDLSDNRLGTTQNDSIQIDINAANHGWYIDPTPNRDDDDDIGDRVDLLTTVLHELNHILGEGHNDELDDLMNSFLPMGTRRLPSGDEASSNDLSSLDAAMADWQGSVLD